MDYGNHIKSIIKNVTALVITSILNFPWFQLMTSNQGFESKNAHGQDLINLFCSYDWLSFPIIFLKSSVKLSNELLIENYTKVPFLSNEVENNLI